MDYAKIKVKSRQVKIKVKSRQVKIKVKNAADATSSRASAEGRYAARSTPLEVLWSRVSPPPRSGTWAQR